MITIRQIATGEIQSVEIYREEDYPPDLFEVVGRVPEGVDPMFVFIDGTGSIVERDPSFLDSYLHARIDEEAGAFRCRYITAVPGQQLTYQRKEAEARAWMAATDPDIAAYPFLAAEAAATGLDPSGAAAEIIAAANLWAAIGSAVEGARIGAKRAVSAATTRAGKDAAAVVDWEGLVA